MVAITNNLPLFKSNFNPRPVQGQISRITCIRKTATTLRVMTVYRPVTRVTIPLTSHIWKARVINVGTTLQETWSAQTSNNLRVQG